MKRKNKKKKKKKKSQKLLLFILESISFEVSEVTEIASTFEIYRKFKKKYGVVVEMLIMLSIGSRD